MTRTPPLNFSVQTTTFDPTARVLLVVDEGGGNCAVFGAHHPDGLGLQSVHRSWPALSSRFAVDPAQMPVPPQGLSLLSVTDHPWHHHQPNYQLKMPPGTSTPHEVSGLPQQVRLLGHLGPGAADLVQIAGLDAALLGVAHPLAATTTVSGAQGAWVPGTGVAGSAPLGGGVNGVQFIGMTLQGEIILQRSMFDIPTDTLVSGVFYTWERRAELRLQVSDLRLNIQRASPAQDGFTVLGELRREFNMLRASLPPRAFLTLEAAEQHYGFGVRWPL